MHIVDNEKNKLVDEINKYNGSIRSLDVCTAYFNFRAISNIFQTLKNAYENMQNSYDDSAPVLRVLIGMVHFGDNQIKNEILDSIYALTDENSPILDESKRKMYSDKIAKDIVNQLNIGVPLDSDLETFQLLRKLIAEKRVVFRYYSRDPLHAKLYIINIDQKHNNKTISVGSSNFTQSGLISQGELNLIGQDNNLTEELKIWFETHWEEKTNIDISDAILEGLNNSWAISPAPEPALVYTKILSEIANSENIGNYYIYSDKLNNILMEHQKEAINSICNLLEKRKIALLADVVGLGKTLTAIGVMSALENSKNTKRFLVVSPVNLVKMWEEHLKEYDLSGEVVSISLLSKKLKTIRSYNYIIVDESHNFRNKKNSFDVLREYIAENNAKVLLLSATPYSKGSSDIANQLNLVISDEEILPIGARKLSINSKKNPKTLAAFREADDPKDWERLLSKYMRRRTRKNIKLKEGFEFPKREVLTKNYIKDNHSDPEQILMKKDNLDLVDSLLFPRYSFYNYVESDHSTIYKNNLDAYLEKIVQDSTSTEMSLKFIKSSKTSQRSNAGFVVTGLFKRMSSSHYAFLKSIASMHVKNSVLINFLEIDNTFVAKIDERDFMFYTEDELQDIDENIENVDFNFYNFDALNKVLFNSSEHIYQAIQLVHKTMSNYTVVVHHQ